MSSRGNTLAFKQRRLALFWNIWRLQPSCSAQFLAFDSWWTKNKVQIRFSKLGKKKKQKAKFKSVFQCHAKTKNGNGTWIPFSHAIEKRLALRYTHFSDILLVYEQFSLLCSPLTVKFLSFGYSCNIQGFWYFTRSRSCKIQVNPRNPTKFTNTHTKCCKIWQKSYRIYVCTTYLKLISAIGAIYLPWTCKFILKLCHWKMQTGPKLRPVSNVVLNYCRAKLAQL